MATLDSGMVEFVMGSIKRISQLMDDSKHDEIQAMIADCDAAILTLTNLPGKKIGLLIIRGIAKSSNDDYTGAQKDFDEVLEIEEKENVRQLVKHYMAAMQGWTK